MIIEDSEPESIRTLGDFAKLLAELIPEVCSFIDGSEQDYYLITVTNREGRRWVVWPAGIGGDHRNRPEDYRNDNPTWTAQRFD